MVSITPAVEDYLRAIYKQLRRSQPGSVVTTSQLADRLGYKPASVTNMVQKMAAADPPLVVYQKHRGVKLTPDGERAALSLMRYHRLLEQYLHEKLGYSWDEVHDEADRLEHAISEQLAERMAAALGYPTHDPHGHAIPTADLAIEPATLSSLATLAAGERAVVQHVGDEDAAQLQVLDSLGLRPGVAVHVVATDPDARMMTVAIGANGEPSDLTSEIASRVFVTELAEV